MMNLQAGGLASKDPLCVQGRERAHSLSAFFFFPPWQKEVFSQLWWKILDGLSKSFTGSVTCPPTLRV